MAELSEELLNECKEAFALFDKANEGIIPTKDLGLAIRAVYLNPTEAELHEMIAEVDPEGAGTLSLDAFLMLVSKRQKDLDVEEDILDAFRVFDKDGNGFISNVELRYILSNLGEKLMEGEDLEEMIKEAECNDDGQINYEEFVKVIMSKFRRIPVMSVEREILEFEFCQWLTENGAKFPKILWPSSQTEGGVRGAIALDDIESLEPMLEIPTNLMMSPPILFQDPVIGSKMQASLDLLQGDLLLTVYVMYEMTKKEKSFYYPYLRILPEPGNVSEWTNEELLELQDNEVILRTKSRQRMINNMYHRTIHGLNRKYPDTFPLEDFTYDLFKFAFNTIQARAFGRRLKWTALVPFADCLNHNNVQTKYDCDIDGNGVFRLFPSGDNHYKKGKEVFNSYGRRPNENLLSDYGFAMLHNEWDEVEVALDLPEYEPNFDFKRRALYSMGMHSNKRFKLRKNEIPFEALIFLRIVSMTEKQMDHMLDVERAEVAARGGYSDDDEDEFDDEFGMNEKHRDKEEGKARGNKSSSSSGASREVVKYYDRVLSLDNEVKALQFLLNILQSLSASFETTLEQDEILLKRINEAREKEEQEACEHPAIKSDNSSGSSSDETPFKFSWKQWSAVHYRLTRKYIIASVRGLVEELLRIVDSLKSNMANSSEVSFLFDAVITPAAAKTTKPRLVRYNNEVRAYVYDVSQPENSMILKKQ